MNNISVISHIYNEEYYLPAWLTYHSRIFDHGIIIDYKSTDKSLDIVRDICPTWTIVQSENKFFDAVACDTEVEKYERTISGFKVALNTTEWFIVDDMSIFKTANPTCFQVEPWTITQHYIDDKEYVTVADFILNFRYINRTFRGGHRYVHNYPYLAYKPGRHLLEYYPPLSTANIFIIWCGFFPWNETVLKRKLQIKPKMSPHDIKVGFGFEHQYTSDKMHEIQQMLSVSGVDMFSINRVYQKNIEQLYASEVTLPIENNVWVVSYGGSGTNVINDNLYTKNTCTNWVNNLCHFYSPIKYLSITLAIYVYAHPIDAVLSQVNRQNLEVNYNKIKSTSISYYNKKYTMDNVLGIISDQMYNWQHANTNYPILLLRYETIDDHMSDLCKLNCMYNFQVKPRTTKRISLDAFCEKFGANKTILENAIQAYESLPDFHLRLI